jgi:hypothetical protein
MRRIIYLLTFALVPLVSASCTLLNMPQAMTFFERGFDGWTAVGSNHEVGVIVIEIQPV